MSFSKFLPVALMVGFMAGLYVVIATKIDPTIALWVPFISAALFFGAGMAKFNRLPKEVIGLTGGMLFAVVLLKLMPFTTDLVGAFWALPLLVFIAATLIVLLELTSYFELAAAYFYGFAGFFAYLFGGFRGSEMTFAVISEFWILLMAGLVLGIVIQVSRIQILNALGVPKDKQITVFDKEKEGREKIKANI